MSWRTFGIAMLLLLTTAAWGAIITHFHASAVGSWMGDAPGPWYYVGVGWGGMVVDYLHRLVRKDFERVAKLPPPPSFRRPGER